MKLEIKKKLVVRSERVKCVQLHPSLPWIASALYSGNVTIHDYQKQTNVKTFEVSTEPVRAIAFNVRNYWIITAADDHNVSVFNYNTMQKLKSFEAHADFIRDVIVHPSNPYLLTCSDDGTVRLFDWDRDWKLVRCFSDHEHYVMGIALNPRDTTCFASASLDGSVKVWSIASDKPRLTLMGHEAGLNCVDFYRGSDKPYLVSGSDDMTVRIWDYMTKQCVHILHGHSANISQVAFHPDLPYLLSTSEDHSVRVWSTTTFKEVENLKYQLGRPWSLHVDATSSHVVGIGLDNATLVLQMGNEYPVVGYNNGRVVQVRQRTVYQLNLKMLEQEDDEEEETNEENKEREKGSRIKDGENIVQVQMLQKEVGICDSIFPQDLKVNSNARYFMVKDQNQYVIYSLQGFKNTQFGEALDFVWSPRASQDYAISTKDSKIKLFRNFQLHTEVKLNYSVRQLFTGQLLGVRSDDSVAFYDWNRFRYIVQLVGEARQILWSESSKYVVVAMDERFYLLKYNAELVEREIEGQPPEAGDAKDIENAFEIVEEFTESVRYNSDLPQLVSGCWIGDCFVFNSRLGRMNYLIGTKSLSLARVEKKYMILGYIHSQNRVFLIDKAQHVISFQLHSSVIQYQAAVLGNRLDESRRLLRKVPKHFHAKLANFLENTANLQEEAFNVTPDIHHKFDLALVLNKIDAAYQIAVDQADVNKWKQLGDLALALGAFSVAEECLKNAKDLSSLFLLYSCSGNKEGMERVATLAKDSGSFQIAFNAYMQLGDVTGAFETLLNSDKIVEAALFARSYCPSQIKAVLPKWKEALLANKTSVYSPSIEPLDPTDDLDIATRQKLFKMEVKLKEIFSEERASSQDFEEALKTLHSETLLD